MAFVRANRVLVDATTSGTGNLTLGSAISTAYQSFSGAGIANGSTFSYIAYTATQFECAVGSYDSGTPALVRTAANVVAGSAGAGSLTNFSGNPRVAIALLAEDYANALRQSATANTTFFVSVLTGTISGGSGYVNGTYNDVPLTGGSGSGATAQIIVAGGAVTVVKPKAGGSGYAISNALSASNTNLGGSGSGFTFTLTGIGSDNESRTGLTAAAPFSTLGRALREAERYDWMNLYSPTFSVAPGMYTNEGSKVIFPRLYRLGAGGVVTGDNANPSHREFRTTHDTFLFDHCGGWTINGLKLVSTSTGGALAVFDAYLTATSVHLGGLDYMLNAIGASTEVTLDTVTCVETATFAARGLVRSWDSARVAVSGVTTIAESWTIGGSFQFIGMYNHGYFLLNSGASFSGGGSVTGRKFAFKSNSVFESADNTDPSTLPGTVAGTYETGTVVNGEWRHSLKQAMPVPAAAMTANTTSGAAAGSVEAATNKNMFVTFDFDATTSESVQFAIAMPSSWDEGTITFQPVWSHAATTTNFGVVWELSAVAVSNDDAGDVAFGTGQTSVDTGGTTNDIYIGPESAAITVAGTPAAGDFVMFKVSRLPANGSDTMAIDARLHAIRLFITTASGNDV